ncbi:MAG TPA: ABC transporter ATP-binding protein [Armatimonadota bacterium]|jgi:branched-chain amino acid transport system ATP-binding protein
MFFEIDNCTKQFGGLTAVKDLDVAIQPRELVGMIGPNGAGKTTVFNLITGVYRPTSGDIRLGKTSLVGRKPSEIAALGIARTFQNIRLFPELTALDNVRIAAALHHPVGMAGAMLHTPAVAARDTVLTERARHLLYVLKLDPWENEKARNLPYGKQRRLEIARALATEPKLLLLDEPAAGLNPSETDDLMHFIRYVIGEFGVTILLIEHDMRLVMGICERIYVLDYGEVIAHGKPEAIRSDPKVVAAYLGEDGE